MRKHTYSLVLGTLCLLVVCLGVGCGNKPHTHSANLQLQMVDDSVENLSPHALPMIEKGMAQATDSMGYYEYLVRLAKYYYLSNTPDSMLGYVDRVIAYGERQAESPRRNALLAYAYNQKAAYSHKFRMNGGEVVALYRKAYDLLGRSDAQDQRHKVCANLGDAYLFENRLPEAAHWYRRALLLVDSLGLPAQEEVSLYMGLATIYMQLNDFDTSLRYYQQTEAHIGEMSVGMQSYFLNNYGNYYYYTKNYTASLAKFREMQHFLLSHGYGKAYDMYLCKLNMADVYLNLGKLAESERLLDEVEPFMRNAGDEAAVYYCHTIRIGLAVKKGDMRAVLPILRSETKPISVAYTMRQVRNSYLRKYYESVGDYRKAYLNLEEDMAKNDSLEHNRTNMRASEIMSRFAQDTIQLHHQVAMAHKDVEIQKAYSFVSVAVALLLALALLLVFLVMRSHKRKAQAQMSIMKLRLAGARNRISPHFVFNVLNNKILNSSQQESAELLGLVKLIRANLDLSCREEVALGEELDFVERYVKVERDLVGPDFDFHIDIAAEVDVQTTRIPAMFVQILTENAFVHGLRGWEGHKSIHIVVDRLGKATRIAVRDNGPGFDARSLLGKQRTGLNIIRQTIAAVNERSKTKMTFRLHNMTDVEGKVAGCEGLLVVPDGWQKRLGKSQAK